MLRNEASPVRLFPFCHAEVRSISCHSSASQPPFLTVKRDPSQAQDDSGLWPRGEQNVSIASQVSCRGTKHLLCDCSPSVMLRHETSPVRLFALCHAEVRSISCRSSASQPPFLTVKRDPSQAQDDSGWVRKGRTPPLICERPGRQRLPGQAHGIHRHRPVDRGVDW